MKAGSGSKLSTPETKVIDEVEAYGHPNVKATHRTTLELTKDPFLTPRGDCIIGVAASKSASELNPSLKQALKNGYWLLVVINIPNMGIKDYLIARGSPNLLFTDTRSIVIRKSNYIDTRTIAINSNKAARDLDPRLREQLKNPNTLLKILLIATRDPQPISNTKAMEEQSGPGGT